jgi:hypothetical protein
MANEIKSAKFPRIPRMQNVHQFTFKNSNNGFLLMRITIPEVTDKPELTKIVDSYRVAVAESNGLTFYEVGAEMETGVVKDDLVSRIIYEWPGGISLNIPSDASDYDFRIILKQMEVIDMAISPEKYKEQPKLIEYPDQNFNQ